MILVLILFLILVTLLVLIIASTLNIKIKNLSISNIQKNKENALNDAKYEIEFSLCLLNKIKWVWFNLNDKKAKKIYTKMQLEKIDYKKLKKDFKLKDAKQLIKLKPKILYLNAELNLGLTSPVATSFLVAVIASAISIALPYIVQNLQKNTYTYNIKPLYYNKNLYKIDLNCIIQVKMVHIINVVYVLYKKGMGKNGKSTTSNRKSYAYSHE